MSVVFILESVFFAWIGISWITIQDTVYHASPIDYIVFYSQAVLLMIGLTCVLCSKTPEFRNEIKKCVNVVNLSFFLLYIHVIDQSFNYNTPPSKKDISCTNNPHSPAYRQILTGTNSVEIACILSAISLSLLFIQFLLSLSSSLSIVENTEWFECTLFLITLLHIVVTARDKVTWFMSFLYIAAAAYLIYFVILFVLFYIRPRLLSILRLVHLIVLIFWIITGYVFLYMHTQSLFCVTYLGICVVGFSLALMDYFESKRKIIIVKAPPIASNPQSQLFSRAITMRTRDGWDGVTKHA
jgi:hypothetical protein